MKAVVAAAFLTATGLSTPAFGCSMLNWNVYESYSEPSLTRLVDDAASIDWVSIEPPGPPACPRPGDYRVDKEDGTDAPMRCRGIVSASPTGFTALVNERLKGASPQRYALAMLQPAWHDGERWRDARWHGFSDLRGTSVLGEVRVRSSQRQIAEGRHRQLWFWDRGSLPFGLDMSDSCGGQATLDPSMTYIAFRDAHGAITALEPVAHDDDALLIRLRARREDEGGDLRESYPVEDFFRSVVGIVQTRVNRCRINGSSYEDEEARLTVERGDPAFIYATQGSVSSSDDPEVWYEHARPGSRTFDFNDLPDFFALRGEACPVGGSVLIVRLAFPEVAAPAFDPEWLEREYPGWIETLPAEWRATLGRAAGVHTGPDRPIRTGPNRPIRIGQDGSVRLDDIPTALRLTGPDTITVDQIFQWFEEGRATTPAPSSS